MAAVVPAAGAAAAAAGAAVVPFALTPAQASGGNILDMTDAGDRKIYNKAVSKLSEELFECVPEGLFQFLRELEERAQEYGWDDPNTGILMVPTDPANPFVLTNLLTNYGEVSMTAITAFEQTYIDRECRAAQDTRMLYTCIMNSLSKEAKTKVHIWRTQYTIQGGHKSGNLLLKVVIRESHLDTNATTSVIRLKLSSLDNYMPQVGSDIVKFNTYVKLLIDSLHARGETSHDTLVNLFKGYQAVSDKPFSDYINRLQESHEDGNTITADLLMQRASDKYKSLKQAGKWNAPSEEEEKIIALEAKIRSLQKSRNHKTRDKSKGKRTNDQKKNNKKSFLPTWHKKPPKPEEMKKPREHNNKKWYWCCPETGGKCNGIWRTHKPEDCRGMMRKDDKKSGTKRPEHNQANDKRALKLAKAMTTLANTGESDSN